MPLSQGARSLAVTPPLGEDILLLRSMAGKECLSTLFEYQLHLKTLLQTLKQWYALQPLLFHKNSAGSK